MFGIRSKDRLEYEFMPDAMEIEETPPLPLGRWLIWTIGSLFTIAVIWSCIGQVDEVATARGKVFPEGRTKVLQPMEEASIKSIFVEEGQRVKKGMVLIEFDSTVAVADQEGLQRGLMIAQIEKDMIAAELLGDPYVLSNYGADGQQAEAKEIVDMQQQLREARDNAYASRLGAAELVVAQREKDVTLAQSKLESLQKQLQLNKLSRSEEQTDSTSVADLLKEDNKVIQSERDIADQERKIEQAEDALSEAQQNVSAIEEQRKRELLDLLVEKEKAITSLNAELTKATKKKDLQQLISPVDGTIHGISSLTIGGVVKPAEAVISVVPEDTPLIVEATVTNQDIGFIKIGQEVFLKVDTFPFQKYGYLYGELMHISPDAFDDEKLGPVYKAKVKIRSNESSRGVAIHLVPGMSLTAEVKTGQRRIIEFFLSPIMKSVEEGFKLR